METEPTPTGVKARRLLTGQGAREILLIVAVYLLYALVRGAVTAVYGDMDVAFAHARDLVRWEQTLGIFWEPQVQSAVADNPVIIRLAGWFYWLAHFPLLAAFGLWMYWRRRPHYPLFRTTFLASAVIGLTVFYLWPLAPPRLLAPAYGLHNPMDGLVIQYEGLGPFANQFAAMPSMHFAWAVLMAGGFVWLGANLALRLFGAALPVVNLWAIVATANHFILDAAAGLAVLAPALLIAVSLHRAAARLRARSPTERARQPAGPQRPRRGGGRA